MLKARTLATRGKAGKRGQRLGFRGQEIGDNKKNPGGRRIKFPLSVWRIQP